MSFTLLLIALATVGGADAAIGIGRSAFQVNGVTSCAAPATFSGNIDLANGNSLNAWQSNAGGGGC